MYSQAKAALEEEKLHPKPKAEAIDLPVVPNLEDSIRDLATVKAELLAAQAKAEELREGVEFVKTNLPRLTKALGDLEALETELVNLTIKYLKEA